MQDNDEINLLEYWNVLWRRKWLIILLFTVSVVAAMLLGFNSPKYYKSETVIMSSTSDAGGLGAALSSIPLAGALAGAAGIQTPADRIMVILKSRTTAEAVIKHFDLLRIFNQEKWDPVKKSWADPVNPPTLMETVRMLSKEVAKISKSKEGAITISVEWKDPELTANIANYYITVLSGFLNEKSINVNIQIVDRAIPAEKKSRPIIRKNMMLAGFMSGFLGVFIAFLLEYIQKQKQSAPAAENSETVISERPSLVRQ